MKQSPCFQEFVRMREQLNKIQEQIRQSQQLFTQDITIDNKSGRELKFTINLEDGPEKVDIQSKMAIPNNSTVTHKISQSNNNLEDSQQWKHSPSTQQNRLERPPFQSNSLRNNKNLALSRDTERQNSQPSVRQQQKFQPISRLKVNNEESQYLQSKQSLQMSKKNPLIFRKLTYGNQILVADDDDDDDQSQIRGNEQIHKLIESKYFQNTPISQRKADENINNQETAQAPIKIDLQGTGKITLPFSIEKNQNTQPKIVINYEKAHLFQQNTTASKKQQDLNWSLHTLERSSLKKPNQSLNFDKQIEKTKPTINKISLTIENSKTYTQKARERSQFLKIQKGQRESRMKERLKTTFQCPYHHSKSRSKQHTMKDQKQQKILQSKKADDLFEKRKDQYLKKLEGQRRQINSIRKPSRQRSISNNNLKVGVNSRLSNHSPLSPKIQEIGNRLHSSKGKSPCDHHNKYNEQQLRQQFNLFVKQNLLVSRYIGSSHEREQLFQKLRRQKDSVSLWPMKMVNYTYSKLRRVTNPPQYVQ